MWPLRLRIKKTGGRAPRAVSPHTDQASKAAFVPVPVQVPGIRPRGPSSNGYPAAPPRDPHPTRGACDQHEPQIFFASSAPSPLLSCCPRSRVPRPVPARAARGDRSGGWNRACACTIRCGRTASERANGRRKGVRGRGRGRWRWCARRGRRRAQLEQVVRWKGRACRARTRSPSPAPGVQGLRPKGSSRWRAKLVPLRRPGPADSAPVGWPVCRARGVPNSQSMFMFARVVLRLPAGSGRRAVCTGRKNDRITKED